MSGNPLPRVLAPWEAAPQAPDPTNLPDGTPHPNPFLAGLGWQVRGARYVREPQS